MRALRARPTFYLLMIVLALGLGATRARARSDEDGALEQLLIEKGFVTEEELEEARSQAAEQAEPAPAPAPEPEPEPEKKVTVSAGTKGIQVASPDGNFVLGLGGRLQIDAGGFFGETTPQGNGGELRRGRIVTSGSVYQDWEYKFEVNFGPSGSAVVTDATLGYVGFAPLEITVGHQKVPFSQQSMTSSNWQVFQERALPDAFIETTEEGRRRLGAVVGSSGAHWNVAAGMFGEGVTHAGSFDDDWGSAGRVVLAPIAEKTRLVTVGGAVYYRKFQDPATTLAFATRPEANLGTRLVNTGFLATAVDSLLYNAESAVVWGPVHAQGEYTAGNVDRFADTRVCFDGWYAEAGWFLTGESRNYDLASAQFKRITPKRKLGAWEIAARYSKIDLQDGNVLGGRESNVTVALNWWVNEVVMFRLNYVRGDVAPNAASLGGFDETLNAITGRAQIVF